MASSTETESKAPAKKRAARKAKASTTKPSQSKAAKTKAAKTRAAKAEPPRRRKEDLESAALRSEVLGLTVLVVSLCLLLALASFHPEDVSSTGAAASSGQTRNLIGPVGASIANIVLRVFGLAAFLLPISLAVPAAYFIRGKQLSVRIGDAIGYPVLILFSAMAAHLWMGGQTVLGHLAGGLMGEYGAEILRALFGLTGAYILTYAVLALTFIITTRVSLLRFVRYATTPLRSSAAAASVSMKEGATNLASDTNERLMGWRSDRAERRDLRAEDRAAAKVVRAEEKAEKRDAKVAAKIAKRDAFDVEDDAISAPARKKPKRGRKALEAPTAAADSGAFTLGARTEADDEQFSMGDAPAPDAPMPDTHNDTVLAPALAPEAPAPDEAPPVVRQRRPQDKPEEQLKIPLPESERHVGYQLPPLSFLDYESPPRPDVDPTRLQYQATQLVDALSTFKIAGRVTEIHPGPVVTMFEFEPAPGVRISKIASLADDLAMALKAVKVRIVAPIPGKGVVGFEVPNLHREMVFLQEVIGSKTFNNPKLELPIALGKDIHGAPAVTDLAKMPHLLVAGTTGSGKSVGVNGMIVSLLYRYGPDEVRFIMVDPKMLELSVYEGIPHLLLPVVTDSKKASLALKWGVDEMERRYGLMKDAGVRNLAGYNRKMEKAAVEYEVALAEAEGGLSDGATVATASLEPPLPKLPYIVIIIDEFADLMMVAGKEVEHSVARIAQKARAAGLHLILATQRPSTDVITGVIKANFPTRMAFRVSSGIDSRTIISSNGAENLLGKGDMLFLPPGTSRLTRVHGAYVDEIEIAKIVKFASAQQEPDYLDSSILEADGDDLDGEDGPDGDMDPMYDEAVRIIARDGRASTSHLQRRLSLGYNRAARIVDQMECDGLVGPQNGSKPRTVNKALLTELLNRWDNV